MAEAKSLIDIGTGAGFPGIPIKILKEDIEITLLDSLQKRINFFKYCNRRATIKKYTMFTWKSRRLCTGSSA